MAASACGNEYTETINELASNGTVGMTLVDDDRITVLSCYALGRPGPHTFPTRRSSDLIDQAAPFVQSINRTSPSSALTNASSVTYTVTFNEVVSGVSAIGRAHV